MHVEVTQKRLDELTENRSFGDFYRGFWKGRSRREPVGPIIMAQPYRCTTKEEPDLDYIGTSDGEKMRYVHSPVGLAVKVRAGVV